MTSGKMVAGGCGFVAVGVVGAIASKVLAICAVIATVMRVFDLHDAGRLMWPLWALAAGCWVVGMLALLAGTVLVEKA